jgi:membrane protease YdiL (CAAX protease family)
LIRGPVLALALAAGCSRPLAQARTSPVEPASPAEIDAQIRTGQAACSPRWGILFPGLAQACLHQPAKAATMATLAAAEIGTGVAVGVEEDDFEHPGSQLPLTAVQDLWVYGLADASIQGSLANAERFAPQDSATDLLAAPFNAQVMKRPGVWLGLAGALAVGIGVSIALSDIDTRQIGSDPNLFGKTVDARWGYPLGVATGGALFAHVAMAEETLFRGYLQGMIARNQGENWGWVDASLLFGVAHMSNALLLPPDQRADYLLYGVPVITAAGFYMGWLFRSSGYSLAPSTALHFWYDTLLTGTLLVLDPQNSDFSASIALPW